MSDISKEIQKVTGLPEIHLGTVPEHLQPLATEANKAVSLLPEEVRHSAIEQAIAWLKSFVHHFHK